MRRFTYVPKEDVWKCAHTEYYNYQYINIIQSPYINKRYDKMNVIKRYTEVNLQNAQTLLGGYITKK